MAKLGALASWGDKYAESLTAATTLTLADNGKMFFLDGSAANIITLPAVAGSAGCKYTFILTATGDAPTIYASAGEDTIAGIVYTLPDNAACQIDTDASCDTITFVNTASVGSRVTLRSNGTLWYVEGFTGIADKLTLTTAA